MSIYISGMEMPKEPIAIIICPDGKVFRVSYPEQIAEAVPVPPHGRLGDLDAVEAEIREKTNEQFCVNIVHAAPTIIPTDADKENENG